MSKCRLTESELCQLRILSEENESAGSDDELNYSINTLADEKDITILMELE